MIFLMQTFAVTFAPNMLYNMFLKKKFFVVISSRISETGILHFSTHSTIMFIAYQESGCLSRNDLMMSYLLLVIFLSP